MSDVLLVKMEALSEKLEALGTIVTKAEAAQSDRLAAALEAHRQLHVAHDKSHAEQHQQNQMALERAELTMRETARLHAIAHEREHVLATDALNKAETADSIRFAHLNESGARSADERATFATKESVDDKTTAIMARLETIDRQTAILTDRLSIILANTARIEALEKADVGQHARDGGIKLVWVVMIGVIGLVLAGLGVYLR